jgi:hypothetical protein
MDVLLAQTPTVTVTPSGNFTDPASWVSLVSAVGVGGFFFIFLTLIFTWFTWSWGGIIVARLFGEKGVIERGYNSLSEFLTATKENQAKISTLFETHIGNCEEIHKEGGPCNVRDMRKAGHSAAEALRELARGTANEKAVSDHADDMRAILRGEKP